MTYLLFHLADLELVGPEFGVVNLLVLGVAVLDHTLDLADEGPARRADRLACLL